MTATKPRPAPSRRTAARRARSATDTIELNTTNRRPALGVWHNPTADYGFGLGPAGSIAAVIALFAVLAAFVPAENKLRNVTVMALVAAAIVGPFALRDRWGRNIYTRLATEARWAIHRHTGANLHETAWFSATPVERSNLPGLLSQVSVAEQEHPRHGAFGVVHHPSANTVSVVIECFPDGAALVDDYDLRARQDAWSRWLAALADEPGLAAVQVVTEAAPTPRAVLEGPLDRFRRRMNKLADTVLEELVDEVTDTTTTRTWVTISWTDTGSKARDRFNADVLPARVERACVELSEAGAGDCLPLTQHELAGLWAGMYSPDRRDAIARHRSEPIHFADVGPVTSVEHRDRYSIGDYDTVSLTVGQAPEGEPSTVIHERLAAGIDGAVAVRWAMHYRPVTSIEARAWSKSIQRAIETRIALRGDRKQTVADTVADEDAVSTAAALARGAALTRVGFTISLTIDATHDTTGPIERTRAAVAPLSPHLRVMDGVHQTSWVSTLPGAMPIPETLTASEWLNQ